MTECTNPVANKRFIEMRTAMLLHTPFFASLLFDVMTTKVGKFKVGGTAVDTAGTNGSTIWFDEDYLAGLELPEAVFLCCHEIAHAMWMHMERGRKWFDLGFDGLPFDCGTYNIAADYVINDMLVKSRIGRMPKGGLLDKRFTGDMLVEDVYRELMKNQQKSRGGGGQPPPGSGKDPDGNDGIPSNDGVNGKTPMDTHIYAPAKASPAEMKRAIATAVHQAQSMGKMPAELERWVTETLTPQVDWKERLRLLVTRAAGRESTTWSTPHRRRLVTQKVYLPSYTGFGAGEIVCVTDTSGSMGEKEFDASWAEFSDIIMNCRPERVWLMACDARVHNVHELPSYTDIYQSRPEMRGGGGTSFVPAFEKVEELGIDPVLMVYFTDGYGTFPDEPPKYPVIWVMTENVEPPFGETVKVEMAKYE
jgi:predicted metal-dependent peptidase